MIGSFRGCFWVSALLLSCCIAEGRETSSPVLYADGGDWSVFIDRQNVACTVTLSFDHNHKGIVFISGGPMPDSISFVDAVVMPARETYEFKIRNETGAGLSAKVHAYEAGGYGYWHINGLSKGTVNEVIRSRTLYVESDGTKPASYDLTGFGKGFQRFADCMKRLESKKAPAPSSPRARRMN